MTYFSLCKCVNGQRNETKDARYNSIPCMGQYEDVSSFNWWNDIRAWQMAVWRAALLRNTFNGACNATKDFNWAAEGDDVGSRLAENTYRSLHAPLLDASQMNKAVRPGASVEKEQAPTPTAILLLSTSERDIPGISRLPQQRRVFLCTVPTKLSDGQQIRVGVGESEFDVSVNAARGIIFQNDLSSAASVTRPFPSKSKEPNETTNAMNCNRRLSMPTVLCNEEADNDPLQLRHAAASSSHSPSETKLPAVQMDNVYYNPFAARQQNSYGSWPASGGISKHPSYKRNNRRNSTCSHGGSSGRRKREISVAEADSGLERRNSAGDTARSSISSTVDGVDLEEIRHFAKLFKMKRLSLGLTQTQVGQTLSLTNGPAYSQSAICRFEKLDITPKSAQKIKPVLERWLHEVEDQIKASGGVAVPKPITPIQSDTKSARPTDDTVTMDQQQPDVKSGEIFDKNGDSNDGEKQDTSETVVAVLTGKVECKEGGAGCKRRKRRTSFTPQALELLNDYFGRNRHPSGAEMTSLAEHLRYDREVIRVWFCNKRQALKTTCKKAKTAV